MPLGNHPLFGFGFQDLLGMGILERTDVKMDKAIHRV
jgi:hypothetical protein